MKIKMTLSIARLIDNIDQVIEKNRKTLPTDDVTTLTDIRKELEKVKVRDKRLNTDLINSISDIAIRLVKYFMTDENNDWLDKLN